MALCRCTKERAIMDEYYLLTFESTHAAISTEKLLKPAEVTIMPVPRFISASCGISVRIRPDRKEQAEDIIREKSHLTPDDYAYYHIIRGGASGEPTCDRLEPIKQA
jgi:hypothetical protein